MSLYTRRSEQYESRQSSDRALQPPEYELPSFSRGEIGKLRFNWSSYEIQSQLPTEILLITVKDDEFNSCYSYMMKLNQVKRSWCDGVGYVDFGEFGEQGQRVRVALIRSKMGPTDALLTVKNAAKCLNPKVALFVGYCATLNPAKSKLGDVVISAKLATYASKKITAVGTEELRGVKVHVSRNMSRLILSAADGWEPPLKNQSETVELHRDAVMVSGPELVDNLERRQTLLRHYPDAIGLEMEGEGLYAAAYDLGIEWAVVKGISDYADGSKKTTEKWRSFSSAMAASVVYNMFKHPDVIRQWSRSS